jgi:glycosyltransferase involved in cell wall biosynthesis
VKITVLLPVYNAGHPLKRAIESILNQDHTDFEFLIIDDSSTDGSADIIVRYAKSDSRIQPIFHHKNSGLSDTLNEGLRMAGCELIARMDQDDESLPHRLRIQCRYLSTRPDVAAVGSFVFYMGTSADRDRLIRFPVSSGEIARTLAEYNCIFHPTVMMRREAVLAFGGYRSEFKNAEDYDLWLRMSRQYQLGNIPIALLRYRFSVSGMTLGRKWEQLYYVFLAQAAHHNDRFEMADCEKWAREKHASIDRVGFLAHVAEHTAEELISLGDTFQAIRLLYRFSGEIGKQKAASIGWHLYRRRLEIWRNQCDEWRKMLR